MIVDTVVAIVVLLAAGGWFLHLVRQERERRELERFPEVLGQLRTITVELHLNTEELARAFARAAAQMGISMRVAVERMNRITQELQKPR